MVSHLVRELVEKQFGKSISTPTDCFGLADHVRTTTGRSLNVTTLQHVMGVKESVVEPSSEELDILADYLGYPNWILLPAELKDGTAEKMSPEEAARYWRRKNVRAIMWEYLIPLVVGGIIAACIIIFYWCH